MDVLGDFGSYKLIRVWEAVGHFTKIILYTLFLETVSQKSVYNSQRMSS